jgi:hypothetical protein
LRPKDPSIHFPASSSLGSSLRSRMTKRRRHIPSRARREGKVFSSRHPCERSEARIQKNADISLDPRPAAKNDEILRKAKRRNAPVHRWIAASDFVLLAKTRVGEKSRPRSTFGDQNHPQRRHREAHILI